MRILYITTIGSTMSFFTSFIAELMASGHTIDIATNESDKEVPEFYRNNKCKIYHIDTSRKPLSLGNIKAIWQIKCLVDKGGYDIVHCHTPLAAMCTRLACIGARKRGTKLMYTAHGFHFYKGAPLKNWLIYFPIEWICSFLTDVLITINKEDYRLAKRDMHAKKTVYVPGVGIDTSRFRNNSNGDKIREEFGLDKNELILLSVGELNENKNHQIVIRALAKIKQPYVYFVVGKGKLGDYLQKIAEELGVRLILTGFRNDVADFYNAADIYILPSIREGLNVSLMEAMASGLPCACGKIRGNIDLIDEDGGMLFDPSNEANITNALRKLLKSHNRTMGEHNSEKVLYFDKNEVNRKMLKLYKGICDEKNKR